MLHYGIRCAICDGYWDTMAKAIVHEPHCSQAKKEKPMSAAYVVVWKSARPYTQAKVSPCHTVEEARNKARRFASDNTFQYNDFLGIYDVAWRDEDVFCKNILKEGEAQEMFRDGQTTRWASQPATPTPPTSTAATTTPVVAPSEKKVLHEIEITREG